MSTINVTLHAPRSTLIRKGGLASALLTGVLLLVASGGCGGRGGSQLAVEKAGRPFGAFAFKPLDGEATGWEQSFKGKVVVVDAFATWCDPCLRALPRLVELERSRRGEGLVVLGVALDRDARAVRSLLARHGAAYPAGLRAENETLIERLADFSPERTVPPIPTTAVLDREGKIRALYVGLGDGDRHLDELEEKIDALLKTK